MSIPVTIQLELQTCYRCARVYAVTQSPSSWCPYCRGEEYKSREELIEQLKRTIAGLRGALACRKRVEK